MGKWWNCAQESSDLHYSFSFQISIYEDGMQLFLILRAVWLWGESLFVLSALCFTQAFGDRSTSGIVLPSILRVRRSRVWVCSWGVRDESFAAIFLVSLSSSKRKGVIVVFVLLNQCFVFVKPFRQILLLVLIAFLQLCVISFVCFLCLPDQM